MPLDVLVYHKDTFEIPVGKRIQEDDEYFTKISKQWSDTLKKGLQELPKPTLDYFQ
jgi:putative proteasome-type protease